MSELDSWAKKEAKVATSHPQCKSCREPYDATIKQLLGAMHRNKAFSITAKAVHAKLKEIHPDYTNGFKSFENHLYNHQAELWNKAKGKVTARG